STVGAFDTQPIGELGTRMTLKAFHSASISPLNVTLGFFIVSRNHQRFEGN
ncbi:hypothetical protein B9Z19DRAFT_989485, partial [Tuber borchii]